MWNRLISFEGFLTNVSCISTHKLLSLVSSTEKDILKFVLKKDNFQYTYKENSKANIHFIHHPASTIISILTVMFHRPLPDIIFSLSLFFFLKLKHFKENLAYSFLPEVHQHVYLMDKNLWKKTHIAALPKVKRNFKNFITNHPFGPNYLKDVL